MRFTILTITNCLLITDVETVIAIAPAITNTVTSIIVTDAYVITITANAHDGT